MAFLPPPPLAIRSLPPRASRPVAPVRLPTVRKLAASPTASSAGAFHYDRHKGIDAYIETVTQAAPMQLVEFEREGVQGEFIKDLAKRMEIPALRMFAILGVPKATAEKRAAAGERVNGASGQAAVGLIHLLALARDIVADSTADAASGFDAAPWLGRWLELPQPALDGRKPADLIDTPTGFRVVHRLLGAIESGAYQ